MKYANAELIINKARVFLVRKLVAVFVFVYGIFKLCLLYKCVRYVVV